KSVTSRLPYIHRWPCCAADSAPEPRPRVDGADEPLTGKPTFGCNSPCEHDISSHYAREPPARIEQQDVCPTPRAVPYDDFRQPRAAHAPFVRQCLRDGFDPVGR